MLNIFGIVREAIPFVRYCDDRGIIFNGSKKAICPFHDDHNPSLHNYGTHGYCFACGRRADIIDLEARRQSILAPLAISIHLLVSGKKLSGL